MVDFQAVGNRIKHYRELMHPRLTQAKLAEKLGVSVSYISQIERGVAAISLNRLDEIAQHLGTTLKMLVSDIEDQDNLAAEITEWINALPQRDKIQLHAIIRTFIEYN